MNEVLVKYFKDTEYAGRTMTPEQTHQAIDVLHYRASAWAQGQQSLSAYYDVDAEAAEAHAAADKMQAANNPGDRA